MTIDERLDRLVERHEALAQTVELFVHSTDRKFAEIAQQITANSQQITALTALMQRLVTVVESHEARLNKWEGGRA